MNGRINSRADDPSRLTKTVREVLRIDLQHYIEIDYPGFVELVDLAGSPSDVAGGVEDLGGCGAG